MIWIFTGTGTMAAGAVQTLLFTDIDREDDGIPEAVAAHDPCQFQHHGRAGGGDLNNMDLRMNGIMKVLTILTTLIMVGWFKRKRWF